MTSIPSIATPPQASILKKPDGFALNAAKHYSEEKIDAVAKEFESQFISQMLENMFSTIDTKDSLGGSESEETFRSLLISEYGKVISRTGGLGIAEDIKRDMLKHQEV
jgi:Rod binding domain-containing protein